MPARHLSFFFKACPRSVGGQIHERPSLTRAFRQRDVERAKLSIDSTE